MNPNEHIRTVILDYITVENPGYALLLNGPWGVGKTHIVNQLRDSGEALEGAHFVSCFGLQSTEDLELATSIALHPVAARAVGFFSRFKGRVAGVDSGTISADAGRFLQKLAFRNLDTDVFVFDDLERSLMAPGAILGFIDRLTNESRARVILIANLTEWKCLNPSQLERVIGVTLCVKPDIEQAAKNFFEGDQLSPALQDILVTTFKDSQHSNLRHLKYAIQRLKSLSLLELESENPAIKRRFFWDLSWRLIEYRHNPTWDLRLSSDADANAILSLDYVTKRYGLLASHSTLKLPDAFWRGLIIEYRIDNLLFREGINKWRGDDRPWLRALVHEDLTEASFAKAISDMDLLFEGEEDFLAMVHHVSTALWSATSVGQEDAEFSNRKALVLKRARTLNHEKAIESRKLLNRGRYFGKSFLAKDISTFSDLLTELETLLADRISELHLEQIQSMGSTDFIEHLGLPWDVTEDLCRGQTGLITKLIAGCSEPEIHELTIRLVEFKYPSVRAAAISYAASAIPQCGPIRKLTLTNLLKELGHQV